VGYIIQGIVVHIVYRNQRKKNILARLLQNLFQKREQKKEEIKLENVKKFNYINRLK